MTEPNWNLPSLLAAIENRGAAPAVIVFGRAGPETWTAERLARTVRRLVAGMRGRGLEPGDRVALWAPNSPQWIASALATMAAGAVLIPIDDLATGEEARRLIIAGKARWLLTSSSHGEAFGDDVADIELRFWLDAAPGSPSAWTALLANEPGELPTVSCDAPAALLATSGTTGRPKIFELSYRNVATNVAALVEARVATASDRVLVPLPLHHAYPLIVGLLTPLTIGTAIILPEQVSGPQLVRALHDGAATLIIGVPRLYEALLTGLRARIAAIGGPAGTLFDWLASMVRALPIGARTGLGRILFAPLRRRIGPKLRMLVSGGAHLSEDAQRDLEALGWRVLPGYGLAETASVFTAMQPGEHRPGSAGRALDGGEIMIDEPDESGVGEILLRGPNITAGYVENPQANAAAFTADGWFRTGDLGRLDSEGFLFVGGRRKEIITLAGGKKVNPEELEKAYAACPCIKDIAVLEIDGTLVALAQPNHEVLHEAGIVEPTHAIEVGLGEIMQRLPSHLRLSGIAITDGPLPRTRLGKYRRFLLPDIYRRAHAARSDIRPENQAKELDALRDDPLGHEIFEHLRQRFPDRAIRLDGNPTLDLGLDSLGWVGLTLELEQRFRIDLSGIELAGVATVRDLIERLTQARRDRPALGRHRARYRALTDPERWLRPEGVFTRAAGLLLYALNRVVVRAYFGLRVEGGGKLPRRGPYVIAPNHVSDLDPLTLAAALPYSTLTRAAWAGTARRLFRNALTRWLCRAVHLFPVDEFNPEVAIGTAVGALKGNRIVIWYPEGWRSPDGRLQAFRPGIGIILSRTNAAVVPTFIAGTFEALPRSQRFPRPTPLKVVFGDPVEPAILVREGPGEAPEHRIASALRSRVAALGAPV